MGGICRDDNTPDPPSFIATASCMLFEHAIWIFVCLIVLKHTKTHAQ